MKVVLSAGAENQDSGALMRIFESLRRSGLTIGACRSAINQMLKDGVTFKERDDEVDIPREVFNPHKDLQKANEEALDQHIKDRDDAYLAKKNEEVLGPRSFDAPGTVFHEDRTIAKVYLALTQSGFGVVAASDVITAMQNAGILFRERA